MTEKSIVTKFIIALLVAGVVAAVVIQQLKSSRLTDTIDVSFNDGPALPTDEEWKNLPLGSPIPALSGTWLTPDGKNTAPDFSGKVVILDNWSIFCPPCVAAIPENNKLFTTYGPKGLVFVGLTPNAKGMLIDFSRNNEFKYPLLSMADTELSSKFNLEFFPTLFLFGRDGKLLWVGPHIMNKEGRLQSAFSKALKSALESNAAAPAASTAAASQVDLPPEFQALIDKAKAEKEKGPQEMVGPKIGDKLPELKGDWLTASGAAPDLKNKVLLIDFFTTACAACIEALPHNNKIHAKYAPRGLVFINATPEKKDLILEFKKERTIDYPVLTNCDNLFKLYGVEILPTTILFDRTGKIVWFGQYIEEKEALLPDFEKALTAALDAK